MFTPKFGKFRCYWCAYMSSGISCLESVHRPSNISCRLLVIVDMWNQMHEILLRQNRKPLPVAVTAAKLRTGQHIVRLNGNLSIFTEVEGQGGHYDVVYSSHWEHMDSHKWNWCGQFVKKPDILFDYNDYVLSIDRMTNGPTFVLLHTTEKVTHVVQKGGPTDNWHGCRHGYLALDYAPDLV